MADPRAAVTDTHPLTFHASDALICAAARTLHLPLLTRDEEIGASGLVKVLW